MSAATTSTNVTYDSPDQVPIESVDQLLQQQRDRYARYGQEHVFAFVGDLTAREKQELFFDAQHTQVENTQKDFDEVTELEKVGIKPSNITPFLNVSDLSSHEQEQKWHNIGLDLIAAGKVAVLLMAGGQGTRLGSDAPKGCYDIGLLSHSTLFQLQAERIQRLRQVTANHTNKSIDQIHLKWYIMTSIVTHAATTAYFKQANYFNLPQADLFFFQQSELPALDNHGKIIMEKKHKISLAPNGNGGIFEGLQRQGALADMESSGIEYIHIYGVDNVLAKVGDPTFIGFAVDKKADCANKAVLKTNPHEKVGVMCLRDGRPSIVEYSELPASMSESRDARGRLEYSAGNIVQHFFTYQFLKQQVTSPLSYHVARKAIPHVDSTGREVKPSSPNGIKLEMFVFDSFERSTNMQCLAVNRLDEFSPVKNKEGVDSPQTARQAVSDYHTLLLQKAGATVLPPPQGSVDPSSCLCEISPLVSYSGEGLELLVKGKTIQLPFQLKPSTKL